MTPAIKPEDVKLGFGDYFLDPKDVKRWFLNISTYMVDIYHFCSAKNKTSVLGKDFGPANWTVLQGNLRSAVYASTEEVCLVSIFAPTLNLLM